MNVFRNLLCLLLFIPAGIVQAQNSTFEVPTTNSQAKVWRRVAATDIEVVYGRPSVKGRTIFGELVPYEQVWRTGSDASTKISFTTTVSIDGKSVESGIYELFTIPGKTEWTIILQENRSQWGSYSYNPEFDVVRTTVQPEDLQKQVETFTIGFDNVTSNSAELVLTWEKVRVPIQITVDLEKTVLPLLEESLAKEGRKPYFRAAMFYFENDLDINRAAELMSMAINDNPNHLGMLYRQALILEAKGDIKAAIEASEKSLNEAKKAPRELREEYIKLNNALLSRLKE